jgi:hypothetical protein
MTRLLIGPIAVLPTAILASHEYGHYLAASSKNLSPTKPTFLGIGPIAIGFIKTDQSIGKVKKYVKKYGPISGILCALSILLYAALLGFNSLYSITIMLIVSELYHLIIGNDSILVER